MKINQIFEELMKSGSKTKNEDEKNAIGGLFKNRAEREEETYEKLLKTASEIMRLNRRDKTVIRTLAECITKGNFDKLDSLNDVYISSNKWLGVFTDLIPEKWLISRREMPVTATFTYENFKVKAGDYVTKGTYIADIVSWGRGQACAVKSGVVLETSPRGVIIGSPFDDIKRLKHR